MDRTSVCDVTTSISHTLLQNISCKPATMVYIVRSSIDQEDVFVEIF